MFSKSRTGKAPGGVLKKTGAARLFCAIIRHGRAIRLYNESEIKMTRSTNHHTDHGYSPLARQFAEFIRRTDGNPGHELYLAALLVSDVIAGGHICLNLASCEKQTFQVGDKGPLLSPAIDAWERVLRRSPVVGRPGEFRPLILDDAHRLYTYRYWNYENKVADRIRNMAGAMIPLPPSFSPETCNTLMARLFPESVSPDGRASGQIIAAFIALTRRLCLISGSPGTGKTTAVARILAFLIESSSEATPLRIALAAPTAKAAIRLEESISQIKQVLCSPDWVKNLIPEESWTIHRLLGSSADGTSYRHRESNPLPCDIVVVDEASMIDLPLMAHLLEAIPRSSRLILLGDPHQLSSIEAGAVLEDIMGPGEKNRYSLAFLKRFREYTGSDSLSPSEADESVMTDAMVELTRNYRIRDESILGRFKKSVVTGDAAETLHLLESGEESLSWLDLPDLHALKNYVRTEIGKYLNGYLKHVVKHSDNNELFASFDSFRVLCALRGGLFGTIHLNRLMEDFLKEKSGIHPSRPFYPGKALMVTNNDYALQLFNGDIGLVLADDRSKEPHSVCFREAKGAFRRLSPYTLPEHETAFAMTVHKSQGSEYERVFLFLPEADNPILNRELIYTGITRARRELTVCGRKDILIRAVSRKMERYSGLTEKIRQGQPVE